MLSISVLTQ